MKYEVIVLEWEVDRSLDLWDRFESICCVVRFLGFSIFIEVLWKDVRWVYLIEVGYNFKDLIIFFEEGFKE